MQQLRRNADVATGGVRLTMLCGAMSSVRSPVAAPLSTRGRSGRTAASRVDSGWPSGGWHSSDYRHVRIS